MNEETTVEMPLMPTPCFEYLIVAQCEEPYTHGKLGVIHVSEMIKDMSIVTSVVLSSGDKRYPEGTIIYHKLGSPDSIICDTVAKGYVQLGILHSSIVVASMPLTIKAVPIYHTVLESNERFKDRVAELTARRTAQRMGVGNGLIN